jgi:hypothetical protein
LFGAICGLLRERRADFLLYQHVIGRVGAVLFFTSACCATNDAISRKTGYYFFLKPLDNPAPPHYFRFRFCGNGRQPVMQLGSSAAKDVRDYVPTDQQQTKTGENYVEQIT